MMKYPAPDGTILESLPNPQVVTYSCPCDNIPDGTYVSYETTSSSSAIGIQQIKITRVINDGIVTITILESTDQELLDYLAAAQNIQ